MEENAPINQDPMGGHNGFTTPGQGQLQASKPLKLTKEEQLTLENYFLKVQNIRLQQQHMRQDFEASFKLLQELRGKLAAFEKEMQMKYGVDLAKATVTPDGTIIPGKTELATS